MRGIVFLSGCVVSLLAGSLAASTSALQPGSHAGPADNAIAQPISIPMDQLGAVAGKQYSGDGLAIVATNEGALLRCVFQRLDSEATQDGLWLKSTVPDRSVDRFCVKAVAVGQKALPNQGEVSIDGKSVRFSRPGLVEEYSVSMDGVRQDFLVLEKPPGEGGLKVHLDVTGANVEQAVAGAQLVLEKSGRKIAYSRLVVTDATGKEFSARIEVTSNSALRPLSSAFAMAVVVDDSEASYPIRIDPTFSDANWISMGGINGADNTVYAAVVDGSGNLFIGGTFTVVGDVSANRIAKWGGNSWSALSSGMNNFVRALAVSGSDLYAGGYFTTAVGSSRVDLQACKLEYSIVSPK